MEDLIQLKSKVQRLESLYVAARERGRSLPKTLKMSPERSEYRSLKTEYRCAL
jgi:hypothetical protein